MVKYADADNCAKGRVKYRVKAAYVIINFVMNSVGPTRARTLDSDSWPAPCHTLCALRPSMSRALSGTKPRRLQLRKWVAIAQVIPSNKELQPIWLQCTVSELSKMTQNSHTKVKQWQVLPIMGSIIVICTRSRKNQDPGVVLQATPFAEMKGLVTQTSSCWLVRLVATAIRTSLSWPYGY